MSEHQQAFSAKRKVNGELGNFRSALSGNWTREIATLHPRASLRTNWMLQGLIVWYAACWILLAVSPRDRSDWLLENLLVFATISFLVGTYRTFPLSNLSYLLITIFLTLHTIGAHYTYEHALPGYWLKELLDLTRNHFDRIVHFSFGLLLGYPLWETFRRLTRLAGFWSYFFPLTVLMAASSFFELLESWVAQIVSPELGAAYLGTQGDVWDAHKDMAVAMIGAFISLAITAAIRKSGRL